MSSAQPTTTNSNQPQYPVDAANQQYPGYPIQQSMNSQQPVSTGTTPATGAQPYPAYNAQQPTLNLPNNNQYYGQAGTFNPQQQPNPMQQPTNPIQQPTNPIQQPTNPIQQPTNPIQQPTNNTTNQQRVDGSSNTCTSQQTTTPSQQKGCQQQEYNTQQQYSGYGVQGKDGQQPIQQQYPGYNIEQPNEQQQKQTDKHNSQPTATSSSIPYTQQQTATIPQQGNNDPSSVGISPLPPAGMSGQQQNGQVSGGYNAYPNMPNVQQQMTNAVPPQTTPQQAKTQPSGPQYPGYNIQQADGKQNIPQQQYTGSNPQQQPYCQMGGYVNQQQYPGYGINPEAERYNQVNNFGSQQYPGYNMPQGIQQYGQINGAPRFDQMPPGYNQMGGMPYYGTQQYPGYNQMGGMPPSYGSGF
ncbi:hypothetical protein CL6EHI_197520 [Entamoeba histolytica]|uniref:Uncharacterized protein n=3 Tax=Entamoeba histolytica TaxID=5759 RepID=C4LVG8_ENTH1|nr:hypothetical protein EHI_197520 [Entamoeba histolytica HM-1:IMSS]EAL46306.1 hypothetical protein EHI_197520 [Entamoeba histolytica HM-1:IMSS]ENY62050.1 glutenin, low molecular weight subunit precursor, putative [Entamoeba histolytica HM-1:IMSS-A]GAT92658.1 hypothetical protein CL6EHI_197520 [Entamoeba histolytica]|eukprot:XP_651693.1 hypothetical protein EHI_197520 [Entamoeba histolytica HM-1:IMSS]